MVRSLLKDCNQSSHTCRPASHTGSQGVICFVFGERKIAPDTDKVRQTLSGAQVSNVLCIYVEIPRTCGASPPQSLSPGRPYCAHCSAHNSVWDTKPRWSPWLCVCACHHTGCRSISGPYFDDEAFTVQHDRPFRACMANLGPDTNNSQVSPSGLENKEMEVNTLGTLVQTRNGVCVVAAISPCPSP